jgi:glycosyltransferase involved in cell wall biosynthesis
MSRKVVVISPMRNEGWIVESFLRAASQYADYIIVGNHFSTDDTIEIARKFPKVIIVDASTSAYDERARRNDLLIEARKLGENNLILAIDADEMLDPRFLSVGGISQLLELPVGTRIHFPSFNILTDFQGYWQSPVGATGFIDDGSLHAESSKIHFPRIPPVAPEHVPKIKATRYTHEFGGLIHFQYLDWGRMLSKTIWYKAWEVVNQPSRSPLRVYRRYQHIDLIPKRRNKPIPNDWDPFFLEMGIQDAVSKSKAAGHFWWQRETSEMLTIISTGTQAILGLYEIQPNSQSDSDRADYSKYEKKLKAYLHFTSGLSRYSLALPARLLLNAFDLIFDKINSPRKS